MIPAELSNLDDLDGYGFEALIASRLTEMGWDCSLTPASGDFGADIVCTLGGEKLVIQCKFYQPGSTVGVEAVQQVAAARPHFGATAAAVVYRGRCTRAAKALAASNSVDLVSFEDVVAGFKYDRTEAGRFNRHQKELAKYRQEYSDWQALCKSLTDEHAQRLEIFKSTQKVWPNNKAKYDWLKYISIILLVTAIYLTSDSHRDAWIGWLFAVSLGVYTLFVAHPGPEPVRPSEPALASPPSPPKPYIRELTPSPAPNAHPPQRETVQPPIGPVEPADGIARLSKEDLSKKSLATPSVPRAVSPVVSIAAAELRAHGWQVHHGPLWRVHEPQEPRYRLLTNNELLKEVERHLPFSQVAQYLGGQLSLLNLLKSKYVIIPKSKAHIVKNGVDSCLSCSAPMQDAGGKGVRMYCPGCQITLLKIS